MSKKTKRNALAVVLALLAVIAGTTSIRADEWRVVDDDRWCRSKDSGRCEVREITLPAWDDVSVKTVNGSIRFESWDRDEIQVKARISVSGLGFSDARELIDQVEIHADESGIQADGPRRGGFMSWFKGKNWSVSYRVMIPRRTDVRAHTTNGGIRIYDVAGNVRFHTTNGGVRLENVGGDVRGQTTNGGIEVTLDGRDWSGSEIDLSTTNGGIDIDAPPSFSADVDARTTNGGIHVDHPIRIRSKGRRSLKGTIGDGGAIVKCRTTNGGVRIKEVDA